ASNQSTGVRPRAAHIAFPFDVKNGSVERSEVWGDASLGRYPARRVAPDPYFVERAAQLLVDAEHPVFICGGGVVIASAEAELFKLVARLSAPVATSISGKGSISEEQPLAVGVVGSNGGTPETRAIVDRADLVVFIGCRARPGATAPLGPPGP